MERINPGLIDTLFQTALKHVLLIHRDLLQIYLGKLPLNISYKLIDCSIQLKTIDKFSTLIKYWPSSLFDVANLNNNLSKEHYALIFNKLNENTVKNINEFNFVGKLIWKFGHYKPTENSFTELFLNFILKINQSDCSSIKYPVAKTKSFHDALSYSLTFNKESTKIATDGICRNSKDVEKAITMHIEFVVDHQTLDKIMTVLRNQEGNPSIRLNIVCYYFRGINQSNICKILQMAEKTVLFGIDFGFSALSNKQILSVCQALGKCIQLKNLTWYYGNLTREKFHMISECISMLPSLRYMDLSMNYKLFLELEESTLLPFESITSLILSGCGIDQNIIRCFTTSINSFKNVRLLDLSCNQNLRKAGVDLVNFIQAISMNLQYLDIMSCNLKSKTLFSLCECFSESKQLNVLKLWENNSTLEYFQQYLYPCLKNVLLLKEFPPLFVNNNQY